MLISSFLDARQISDRVAAADNCQGKQELQRRDNVSRMIRKKHALGLDPRVGTGFPKRSCSNKKIERDHDSKKRDPAL
jgi:hypothetical protein